MLRKNILFILTLTTMTGCISINKTFKRETDFYLSKVTESDTTIVTEQDILHLPEPVQKYLRYTNVIGKPKVKYAHINATGLFKMSVKQDFIKIKSTQYNFLEHRARFFKISAKKLGIPIKGRDKYEQGVGNMIIKLALFKVADVKNEEINKSALVTYLNDLIVMIPGGILNSGLIWEPVDSLSAKVSIEDCGVKVSAMVYFDREGKLVNFITNDRYFDDGKGKPKNIKWSTPMDEYVEKEGYKIPKSGRAIWHLPEGEFCYAILNIEKVEFYF